MFEIINDVETGKAPAYPDLQPQRFDHPLADVFAVAREVARGQKRWRVTESEPPTIRAVYTTAFFRFKDDITITLSEQGDSTLVSMRSKSRLGKSDLGQNARTIRAFQRALAEAMARG